MAKAHKFAETAITVVAKAGWAVFEKLNSISPNARSPRSGRTSRF